MNKKTTFEFTITALCVVCVFGIIQPTVKLFQTEGKFLFFLQIIEQLDVGVWKIFHLFLLSPAEGYCWEM